MCVCVCVCVEIYRLNSAVVVVSALYKQSPNHTKFEIRRIHDCITKGTRGFVIWICNLEINLMDQT